MNGDQVMAAVQTGIGIVVVLFFGAWFLAGLMFWALDDED